MSQVTELPLHEVRASRMLPAPLERAINSAFSRGPGYEPTPRGKFIGTEGLAGYYIDYSAKTTAAASSDVPRLLPLALVQLALGWWERRMRGEEAALVPFLELLSRLERQGQWDGGNLLWRQRARVPKYGLTRPWLSALNQGQAASAFARALLATGDERYAHLARAAARPMLSDRSTGLVESTSVGPVLQEAPSRPPAHILNGWISGLFGLYDVARTLDDAHAMASFEAGLACLEALLPAYDTGWWSRYSLYPHALEDLAKPIYHRFHIAQLEALYLVTGADFADRAARRWRSYQTSARTACALIQKAAFALADRGRRRASVQKVATPDLD